MSPKRRCRSQKRRTRERAREEKGEEEEEEKEEKEGTRRESRPAKAQSRKSDCACSARCLLPVFAQVLRSTKTASTHRPPAEGKKEPTHTDPLGEGKVSPGQQAIFERAA